MEIKAADVKHRFLRYVQIDTQSDPNSNTFPSTEKQKNLAQVLVEELKEMGVHDAYMDAHGYVFGTVPSNTEKQVPVVCFCSHMDTSPDASGRDVRPLVHPNYQGGDIVLPEDTTQVLNPKNHPDLGKQIGHDIITASGTTLLGADNKAGLAEIMESVSILINNPEIKHGKIRILFTPDEEIGRGVDYLDMQVLGADFGYTIDGEAVGCFEDETFSADGVQIDLQGGGAHPGFAKGKLQSALKAASDIIAALPKDGISPETTNGREGFLHPVNLEASIEGARLQFIVRDFKDEKLEEYERLLEATVQKVLKNYPGITYTFSVQEQYRNMKRIIEQHPEVSEIAVEAIRRAGLTPEIRSIRGGTDGSRLSFMGLPCPNVFTGAHAFHGKQEWVSVQDMEKAVATIVHIAQLWEERA